MNIGGRALALAALVVVGLASSTPGAAADPSPLAPGSDAAGRAATAVWAWPVDGSRAIARPYVAPAHAYGSGHRGVDLSAPAGAQIRAPADGIVHFAGVVVDRPVISLEHVGGVLSSFEPVASELVAGDRVRRGDVIGELQAGHCAAACLHLGARVDGEYVNPLTFLGGVPRAVLLPVRR